jgi:phosphatidylglycerophosphate synthase
MALEEVGSENTERNFWQNLSDTTNTIVTPSNMIDAAAFIGAAIAAPNLDKTWGILLGTASYGADGIDGKIARYTGTTSKLGAKIDAVGDKIKLGWALYYTWKNNQVPKSVIVPVAAHNLANTVITLADQLNEEPQIVVGREGKASIRNEVIGTALCIVGSKIEEYNKPASKALKAAGMILAIYFGVLKHGTNSTREYYRAFKGGKRKY